MKFLEAIPHYPIVTLWLSLLLLITIATVVEGKSKRKNRD